MDHWEMYAPELMSDLYEFTMGESYFREGMHEEATFSVFIRDYPPNRAYFVAAGIEHLLDIICGMRFAPSSIDYLASTEKFSPGFLAFLKDFRFTGTVRAMREGRIFFTQEPVIEVTAPIIEGQILETLVLNIIQLETLVASKAARCVQAARGRPVVDFSFRRTQGIEAGVKAARASYLAGFIGTSNVLAGKLYDIPVYGTMAHSYITSFHREAESFRAFARAFPDNTVLLIDTYDTLCGARKAVEIARSLASQGKSLKGVRLDSGDLVQLSRQVRSLFNDAGFPDVSIMASGNLDEYRLEELLDAGAEIDTFAVGTRMGVSADAPCLDIAYKLVQYDGRPILKLSSGKKTWVGEKQVYRSYDCRGKMKEDWLCLLKDGRAGAEPLLEVAVERGERVRPPESLDSIRGRFRKEWASLPEEYKANRPQVAYPLRISPPLLDMDRQTTEERRQTEIEGAESSN